MAPAGGGGLGAGNGPDPKGKARAAGPQAQPLLAPLAATSPVSSSPANSPLSPHPKAQPQQPPLLLTVRFNAALPDIELDIPRPAATTVVSLKHLIRRRLSDPDNQRRLRFIHAGRILPDAAALSAALRLPGPPPTPRAPASNDPHLGAAAAGTKGKQIPGRPDPALRTYVNCSVGDVLTPEELREEADAALAPPSAAPSSALPRSVTDSTGTPPPSHVSVSAAPRGFDRLRAAGLSEAEVGQLRLQFRSIHAARYTPDTLPSPDSFRRMEDAWIDSSSAGAGGGSAQQPQQQLGTGPFGLSTAAPDGPADAAAGADSEDAGLAGMMDVLIRSVALGFMWPLGSAAWLVREEGMSSGRARFMLGIGVLFSVLLGIVRAVGGEP